MNINEITDKIIGCTLEIHKKPDSGFLESVYQTALAFEISQTQRTQRSLRLKTIIKIFLEKLKNNRLDNIMTSWICNGSNKPVSVDQLKSTIDASQVKDIAAKSGMSEDNLLSTLTDILPDIFDKIYPPGKINFD